ncbi:MAG: PD-(D/E)XK nuclease family protein [Candidatus Omnitrophota bacterium]
MKNRTLLVGPAGSGKTHTLLDEFHRELQTSSTPLSADSFFLLPSAEHVGRIASRIIQRGIPGFFHRRVTTFSRLIEELFSGGEGAFATSVQRYLILKEVLEKKSGPFFGPVKSAPGFIHRLLSFISELKESRVRAPLFREKMKVLGKEVPEFGDKYKELADLYDQYEKTLAEHGLKDRQDLLFSAEMFQPPARRFKKIWIDGFYDFSGLQFAYLEKLLAVTDEVTMTLTLDPAREREPLFRPLLETQKNLMGLGFQVREIKRLSSVRVFSPALAAIEAGLFTSGESPAALSADGVEIFEAVGLEGEVEMIARTIERMMKQGDHRFSDFAVLLRRIGDYQPVIRSVFSRYTIPVEIHERERLSCAPAIQAISGLLRIFCDGWKREDLMGFLRSSYVRSLGDAAKVSAEICALEHRAIVQGIFEGRTAWTAFGGGDAGKGAGEAVFGLLASVEDELRGAGSSEAFIECLRRHVFKTFGIFERADGFTDVIRRDAAAECRFETVLEEIELSFRRGCQTPVITLEAFAERFFRLVELDLFSLHERGTNKVQVYDVSLARQKEYRVVFLAGLLEKHFPVQFREDALLSDAERKLFNRGSSLWLEEKLAQQATERYLFYLAVTRAREKLFLSYPYTDLDGNEELPSYYVEEVRRVFGASEPAVRRQELSRPYPGIEQAVNEHELEIALLGSLAAGPRENSEEERIAVVLLNELLKRPASRERFCRAFYEIPSALTDPRIRALGVFLRDPMSASRFEDYAKCPFAYYAERVLQLKDPEEDLNAATRGTVLHEVLEACFNDWSRDKTWGRDLDRAVRSAKDHLEATLKKHSFRYEKLFQKALEREDLERILEHFLLRELERLAEAPFRPSQFEWSFGDKGDRAGPLEFSGEGRKIRLRGRADRVDVDSSGKLAIVMDYKTNAIFKKKTLASGIALQLPLYLLAVEKWLGLKPVAGLIYNLQKARLNGFYHEDHKGLFPEASSQAPFYSEEEFREVLDLARRFVLRFAADMEAMAIPVKPRECRDGCSFAAVCRIEKWKIPYFKLEHEREDAAWRKRSA